MSFFMGLAEGIATGASRTINTVLDKRQEEASAARKFMMQRRIQEADRYNADMKEAQEQFDAFVGLVGEENMDKAAQIMKGAGSSEQRQELLNYLTAEKRKNEDFDILAAYEFSEMEAGKFGRDDYLRTMVRDPAKLAMPASKKVGLGMADKLFGKQPDMSEGLLPTLRGQKIEGFAGAVAKPGVFSEAKEYELKMEADRVALATSKAGLLKVQKEITNLGGLTKSEGRTYWKDSIAEAVNLAKLPVNEATGEFDLSSAPEQLQEARDAYSDALADTIRYFKDTGTLNNTDGQNQLKSFARNPFVDMNRDNSGKPFTPLTQDGGFDYSKMELGKVYGVGTPAGKTAKYLFAGFDDEDKPLMFQLQ